MAVDPRKRQKKLEKRKSKDKAKRKQLAQRAAMGMGEKLGRFSAAPILHCCLHKTTWDQGIGALLVSRQSEHGNVAFAVFLVDVFCLGVKDASCSILSRGEYDAKIYPYMFQREPVTHVSPEHARKLVESAVAYANYLGLPPHPDYSKARMIFGDIDASLYPEEFEFGKEGKPLFIAGPHDSLAKCRRILASLDDSVGRGNYNFVMQVGALGGYPGIEGSLDEEFDDEGFDDKEFGDDEIDAYEELDESGPRT
jgi:hypothetical protein